MTALLYATIWLALALFVAGEFGKRTLRETGRFHSLAWAASAAGLAIGIVHVVLALAINNDWDHAIAWRVTEERTTEMFGLGWGGLLAGNYAFLTYWAVDLWRWRARPAGLANQPAIVTVGLNAFVLGIVFPAAVVFAAGPRRWLGVVVVLAMLWSWRPLVRRPGL